MRLSAVPGKELRVDETAHRSDSVTRKWPNSSPGLARPNGKEKKAYWEELLQPRAGTLPAVRAESQGVRQRWEASQFKSIPCGPRWTQAKQPLSHLTG